MKILVVIPARGGSKGIPRKNVRLLAGKPLISYVINTLKKSSYKLDICISTDDDEIEQIGNINNTKIIKRDENLANDEVTLDPVVFDAYRKMSNFFKKDYDFVITVQPTSPLLKSKTLDKAISYITENNIDSLISVVNNPHLFWKKNEDELTPGYNKRLNRQYLPPHYSETGAFVISSTKHITEQSRLNGNISVFEISEIEAIDIDTPQDWWIAEKELNKKKIIIRVEGFAEIGLGHIFRGLSLAYGLIDHEILFVISSKSDLGIKKLEESHFPYKIIDENNEIENVIQNFGADIIINDILNTEKNYMKKLKKQNIKVINFEDLGNGSKYADAVINDLYAANDEYMDMGHYYWGSDYYIIRDEFLNILPNKFSNEVKNILIIFGGVDPNNFHLKVLKSLRYLPHNSLYNFTFIVGPGYKHLDELRDLSNDLKQNINIVQDVKSMSSYMKQADLAISSQGRTMLELAYMRVPTILLAQNKRELTHEFGYISNGFINLGLGNDITENTMYKTLNWLIETPQIRLQLFNQMKEKDLTSGFINVLSIILS